MYASPALQTLYTQGTAYGARIPQGGTIELVTLPFDDLAELPSALNLVNSEVMSGDCQRGTPARSRYQVSSRHVQSN